MDKLLYLKARDAGFTSREVHGHHPESLKLYEFLAIHDVMDYNDFFEWKMDYPGTLEDWMGNRINQIMASEKKHEDIS